MRVLTAQDVRAAMSMLEVIAAVREGFIALSGGRARVPLRSALEVSGAIMLTMPAHLDGSPINSVKIVSVCPQNPGRGLPTLHALVLVTDAHTGVPLALLEGATLTALRTGAASGLATDLLARPDATVLGVIGAGVQARTQIEAVCAVRHIREIRLYSPHSAELLAGELRGAGDARIIVAADTHAALRGADIIVAATNSRTPVVWAEDVAPGAHINAIGSFTPDAREVDEAVVVKSKIVVDHRESAWAEAGDLIIPRHKGLLRESDVHDELGELAAGLAAGRTSADEITLFKSVGNAVQDAAVAARIVAVAEQRGLGTEVRL